MPEKIVFEVMVPLDGPEENELALCVCDSPDSLAAIVKALVTAEVAGPSFIRIRQKLVAINRPA